LAGIIERKLIEKKLLRLSSLDELTGLANRRKFMEQLTESLKLAERFGRSLAVLFLDLDFFKAVNDAHGHEYGDLILVNAARRIKTSVRETDLVARLGGDEFIVMLEMITSAQEAEDIARSIIRAVSAPYQINGTLLTIGVSIGVSLFPQHDRTSEGLLKKADLALYGAKENRGKAIVFEGIVS
ncbi:MAG: diguanylate cyclase domain-containing protein, partial [Gammaproteobacteria bacterium]